MTEANIDHLAKYILELSGQKQLDDDTAIFVRAYCSGMVQTVCEWLLDNIKCDPDHLCIIEQIGMENYLIEQLGE